MITPNELTHTGDGNMKGNKMLEASAATTFWKALMAFRLLKWD